MIFTEWGRQGNWGGASCTNPLPRVFPAVKSKMAETVRPYLRVHSFGAILAILIPV